VRNGDNLVTSQRDGLLPVEEPRVSVVERNAVIFFMVQELRLTFVFTVKESQYDEH
jgi:hypothetical protein